MAKARETAEETGESAESEQKKPVINTKVSGGGGEREEISIKERKQKNQQEESGDRSL